MERLLWQLCSLKVKSSKMRFYISSKVQLKQLRLQELINDSMNCTERFFRQEGRDWWKKMPSDLILVWKSNRISDVLTHCVAGAVLTIEVTSDRGSVKNILRGAGGREYISMFVFIKDFFWIPPMYKSWIFLKIFASLFWSYAIPPEGEIFYVKKPNKCEKSE